MFLVIVNYSFACSPFQKGIDDVLRNVQFTNLLSTSVKNFGFLEILSLM